MLLFQAVENARYTMGIGKKLVDVDAVRRILSCLFERWYKSGFQRGCYCAVQLSRVAPMSQLRS